MAAFYFRKSFLGSVAMALATMNVSAQSALDQWGDARMDLCSEELQQGGDYKTLAKAVRKELKAEDTLGVYLSPAMKPLLKDARERASNLDASAMSDLERYETLGIMSPESSLQILGSLDSRGQDNAAKVIRSYDMQLKDGNVLVWPAVWSGQRRARLTLEPMLSVPEAKIDPALVAAMKKNAPSLSIPSAKKASSDLVAERNSQGAYEFQGSLGAKQRDMGGLDEFFDKTLDGFCRHRTTRTSWAKNRSRMNEKKKSEASAQHAE